MEWEDRQKSSNVELNIFGVTFDAESEKPAGLYREISAYRRSLDGTDQEKLLSHTLMKIVQTNKGTNRYIFDADDAETAFNTIRKAIKEGNDSPERIVREVKAAVSANRSLPKAVIRGADKVIDGAVDVANVTLDIADKTMNVVSAPYYLAKRLLGKK
jgi:hypothetical protein